MWPVAWQTPSSRQRERPRRMKPQLSWLQPKSGHESRSSSTSRQADWLTDRPTVSCKVTNSDWTDASYLVMSPHKARCIDHTDWLRVAVQPMPVQFISPWRWTQHGTPKHRYPTISLQGFVTQKTETRTQVENSDVVMRTEGRGRAALNNKIFV
jgi:hypothetical protein